MKAVVIECEKKIKIDGEELGNGWKKNKESITRAYERVLSFFGGNIPFIEFGCSDDARK